MREEASRRGRLWGAACGFALSVLVAVPVIVYATGVSVPNNFANGQIIDADDMNANFDALVAGINDTVTRLGVVEATSAHLGYRRDSVVGGLGMVTANASADIRPPAGETWYIERVSKGNFATMGLSNGSVTTPLSQPAGNVLGLFISNSLFVRVNNTGATPSAFYYSGRRLPAEFVGTLIEVPQNGTTSVRPPVGEVWLITHLGATASDALITDGQNGVISSTAQGDSPFRFPFVITNDYFLTWTNPSTQNQAFVATGIKLPQ